MFGKKKSAGESMAAISESLVEVESARRSALKSAARAAKAAERTEQKAIKAAAEQQRKADALAEKTAKSRRAAELKNAKQVAATRAKADKRTAELARKSAEEAAKAAKQALPPTLFERATDPKAARRALTVAKVIGPALAPLALKAATAARDVLDRRRARTLGVAETEVGKYRGPTGAAEARIAGLKRSIADLRQRRGTDLQSTRFADVAGTRISDLGTAVQVAATMPAARRRRTLLAVNRELDQIDADLMELLVPPTASGGSGPTTRRRHAGGI